MRARFLLLATCELFTAAQDPMKSKAVAGIAVFYDDGSEVKVDLVSPSS
jgi:hypothetical protein